MPLIAHSNIDLSDDKIMYNFVYLKPDPNNPKIKKSVLGLIYNENKEEFYLYPYIYNTIGDFNRIGPFKTEREAAEYSVKLHGFIDNLLNKIISMDSFI